MTESERAHIEFAITCLTTDPGVPGVEHDEGGTTMTFSMGSTVLELDRQANSALAHVLWPTDLSVIESCAYCAVNGEVA